MPRRPLLRRGRPIPDWVTPPGSEPVLPRNAPPEPAQTSAFQPSPPVGTGLYGVDRAGQTWQYVPPGVIPLTTPGGPFLPVSGGTMQGPLVVTATGATTPRSIQDRWSDVYHVQDFGAVGDGTADDSAALQAAVNAAFSAGGGTVGIGRLRLYIAGNVNVPYNVGLEGEFRTAVADYRPSDWYQFGGQIKLATGATVTINSGNCSRILFIHDGLYTNLPQNPTDATNLVANFGGIGVSAAGTSDAYISECMFVGFTTGIDATNSSRLNVMDCRFDCTNGIYCSNSADISRYHRNHFWPFLTNYIPGVGPGPNAYLPLQRAGYAMKMEHNTWDQLIDCFQFGYYQGFWIDSCSNNTLVACHSDYTTPNDNSVAGFQFTGTNNYSKLIGSFVVSCAQGGLINETGGNLNPVVEIIGGTFAVTGPCINVVNGAAIVSSATFEVGTVGVNFGSGTLSGAVIGCNFNGVTENVTFANPTVQGMVAVLGSMATGISPAAADQNVVPLTVPQIAFSALAASNSDLSHGVQLWPGYGISAYAAAINVVVNGMPAGSFTNSGLNGCAIGQSIPAAGAFSAVEVGTTSGPNIRSGTGSDGGVQPAGSLWLRTDGAVGTHLYVSAGGGVWNAVAGV